MQKKSSPKGKQKDKEDSQEKEETFVGRAKPDEFRLKYRVAVNLSQTDITDLEEFKKKNRMFEDAEAIRKILRDFFMGPPKS